MTPEIRPEDELAQLLETTAEELRDTGLTPTETTVEYDGGELWGYIWLAEAPANNMAERKETATRILREQINGEGHDLPTTVNINYGDAGDSGIAVWWS